MDPNAKENPEAPKAPSEAPSATSHMGPLGPTDLLRPDWRRRPIVLVGMMGSGKTTVGKRVAAKMHLPFVDADAAIEEAAKMPITEIFAKFGEPHFRDGERRVIGRLLETGPKVIATGGGAFMDPETRRLILEHGTAIWLDAEIETLVNRVGKRNTRPLLIGKDPYVVLSELMAVRKPFYEQAHIRVVSEDAPHEHTVNALFHELNLRDPKVRT